MLLLVIESLHSVLLALLYIAIFSFGALAGMALLSVLIAAPLHFAARRATQALAGLQLAIGLGTIGLGASIIYRYLVA